MLSTFIKFTVSSLRNPGEHTQNAARKADFHALQVVRDRIKVPIVRNTRY